MTHPRVVLASDNAPMAGRLRLVLANHFDVIGVVSGREELEAAVEVLAPEAVIADLERPGRGGLVAVRRILARHAGLPVVLLSVIDDCAIIQMGSSAGIHGYLLMEHAVEELVFALETVLKERGRPSATTGYRQPDRVKERHSRRRRSNHESLTGWVSLAAL